MSRPTSFGKWKSSILDKVPQEHKDRVERAFAEYYNNVKCCALAKAGRASEEIIQKFQDRIDGAKAVIGEFDNQYNSYYRRMIHTEHLIEMFEEEENE